VLYEISYIFTMKCRGVGIDPDVALETVTKVAEFSDQLLCMVTVSEMEARLHIAPYPSNAFSAGTVCIQSGSAARVRLYR
jgi:hypothetical protein